MASIRGRLWRAIGAYSFGQVSQVVVQLVVVPIYLYSWGIARFGDWLLISTIPAYLAASDLGFISAASNSMCASTAKGERGKTLRTYRTAWGLATLFSLAFTVAFVVGAWILRPGAVFAVRTLTEPQVFQCFVLLALYAGVSQQESVLQAGFRAEGRNALGVVTTNTIRTLTVAASAGVAFGGASPVGAAAALLAVRVVGLAWQAMLLRRVAPYLSLGLGGMSVREMRNLAAPSIAFLGLPLGNLITLQGFLVVLGHFTTSTSLVAFSLVRTLSRFGTQLVGIIEASIWPEVSFAFGRQDVQLLRSLHNKACAVSFYVSVAAAGGLAICGAAVVRAWTGGRVDPSQTAILFFGIDLVLTALWSTSAVLPAATNQIGKVSISYISCGLLSLALLGPIVRYAGSASAPLAMVACDLLMIPLVVGNSIRQLGESTQDFLLAFSPKLVAGVFVAELRGTMGKLRRR